MVYLEKRLQWSNERSNRLRTNKGPLDLATSNGHIKDSLKQSNIVTQ